MLLLPKQSGRRGRSGIKVAHAQYARGPSPSGEYLVRSIAAGAAPGLLIVAGWKPKEGESFGEKPTGSKERKTVRYAALASGPSWPSRPIVPEPAFNRRCALQVVGSRAVRSAAMSSVSPPTGSTACWRRYHDRGDGLRGARVEVSETFPSERFVFATCARGGGQPLWTPTVARPFATCSPAEPLPDRKRLPPPNLGRPPRGVAFNHHVGIAWSVGLRNPD